VAFYRHLPFWLYLLTLLPFALCLWTYGTRSPWQRSATGRALFTLLSSLVAVLSFAVLVQITELPAELRDAMRCVLLGAVALAGWVLFTNIRRLQKDRNSPAGHPLRRSTDNI